MTAVANHRPTSKQSPTPSELLRGLLDLFAKFERSMIRARTRAALERRRADGYEFDYGRSEVEFVRSMRKSGMTLQAVVDRLNAGGVPCKGKRWHLSTVARICKDTRE